MANHSAILVTSTDRGLEMFFGAPQAGGERVRLSAGQVDRIAALNDQGKAVSVLIVGQSLAGANAMRDEPRPDAHAGLKALSVAGIKV